MLAAQAAALGSAPSPAEALSALTHRKQPAAEANTPSIVQPCVRAPPPSLQHLIHSRATIHPLSSTDIFPYCRQPLSGELSGASHASKHKHGAIAEPQGMCQRRTICLSSQSRNGCCQPCYPGTGLQVPSRTLQKVQPAAGKTSEAYPVREGQHLQGKHMRQASRATKHLPGALINKAI